MNLKPVKATLYILFSIGEDDEVTEVKMCAHTSHSDITETVNQREAKKSIVKVFDKRKSS